jgi:hypothetical protein
VIAARTAQTRLVASARSLGTIVGPIARGASPRTSEGGALALGNKHELRAHVLGSAFAWTARLGAHRAEAR